MRKLILFFLIGVFLAYTSTLGPIYIVLSGCSALLAVAFFFPKKKIQQKQSPKQDLNFQELSRHWLSEKPKDHQKQPETSLPSPSKKSVKTKNINATGPYKVILNSFWHEHVIPYVDIFEEFSLIPILKELFALLDLHGGVSSVRRKDSKDRLREDDQYAALSKIPLSVHSINVAKNVFETVKERFPDNISLHLPGLVVAALAHDIGKLEIISGQRYVTGQHPIDGAKYVEEKLMNAHPWAQKVAELVRRHHEAVLDRTPVDLAILIRADKKAREQELQLSDTPLKPEKPQPKTNEEKKTKTKLSLEVKSIPDTYPLEKIFDRLREVTNVILPNRTWVSFSQPDGVVYVQAETLHEIISRLAQEAGFEDAFFHATDKETKKSCLQSFYDEFRRRGWVPEKLVGAGFYGNFFWVWNPVSKKKIKTFYMPIKAEALKAEPAELEAERQAHAILASVKVLGVAIPGKKY